MVPATAHGIAIDAQHMPRSQSRANVITFGAKYARRSRSAPERLETCSQIGPVEVQPVDPVEVQPDPVLSDTVQPDPKRARLQASRSEPTDPLMWQCPLCTSIHISTTPAHESQPSSDTTSAEIDTQWTEGEGDTQHSMTSVVTEVQLSQRFSAHSSLEPPCPCPLSSRTCRQCASHPRLVPFHF